MDAYTNTRAVGRADRAAARVSRLSPRWRKLLLTIHVSTAVSIIGATLSLIALGIAGLRGEDPATVYPALSMVESWVTAPLAIAALGSGLLLALLSEWGLVTYWWVAIKFTLTTVLTVLIFTVVIPGLAAAADSATGVSSEPLTDAQQFRIVLIPAVATTLLVLNAALGLYKPRWRLRSR
jgi:hypothetical protein